MAFVVERSDRDCRFCSYTTTAAHNLRKHIIRVHDIPVSPGKSGRYAQRPVRKEELDKFRKLQKTSLDGSPCDLLQKKVAPEDQPELMAMPDKEPFNSEDQPEAMTGVDDEERLESTEPEDIQPKNPSVEAPAELVALFDDGVYKCLLCSHVTTNPMLMQLHCSTKHLSMKGRKRGVWEDNWLIYKSV